MSNKVSELQYLLTWINTHVDKCFTSVQEKTFTKKKNSGTNIFDILALPIIFSNEAFLWSSCLFHRSRAPSVIQTQTVWLVGNFLPAMAETSALSQLSFCRDLLLYCRSFLFKGKSHSSSEQRATPPFYTASGEAFKSKAWWILKMATKERNMTAQNETIWLVQRDCVCKYCLRVQ